MELQVEGGRKERRELGGKCRTIAAEAQGVKRKRDEDGNDGPGGDRNREKCARCREIELYELVFAEVMFMQGVNTYQKLPCLVFRALLVVFTLVVHNCCRIWNGSAVLRAVVVIIRRCLFWVQVRTWGI